MLHNDGLLGSSADMVEWLMPSYLLHSACDSERYGGNLVDERYGGSIVAERYGGSDEGERYGGKVVGNIDCETYGGNFVQRLLGVCVASEYIDSNKLMQEEVLEVIHFIESVVR